MGRKVALALASLHSREVLHRDLKPEHIILRESDGEPVLLDLGAGWYEGADTLTGSVLPPGTLHLRSPEAILFRLASRDNPGRKYHFAPTDDLYALGVCLYRAATGHYPFFPDDYAEVLQARIAHQKPPAPSALNPRVPRVLSELILRLLSKRPEARWQTGEALAEALVAAVALGRPGDWEARLFEWEELPPEKEGDAPRRRIRRPEWPQQPALLPPPGQNAPARAPAPKDLRRRPRERPEEVPPQATPRKRRVGLMAGALLTLGVACPGACWLGHTASRSHPTSWVSSGQEVAPARPPPESGRAAAPPQAERNPAAVAPRATLPEEDASVKKPQKSLDSALPKVCLGALAATHLACAGPQQRPPPPPQECPPGAVELMTEQLGIDIRRIHTAVFPYTESRRISVHEGPAMVRIFGTWGELPPDTYLFGRLHFSQGRVIGRFTEARLEDGRTFPVCFELFDGHQRLRGAELLALSGQDRAEIIAFTEVMAVESFE